MSDEHLQSLDERMMNWSVLEWRPPARSSGVDISDGMEDQMTSERTFAGRRAVGAMLLLGVLASTFGSTAAIGGTVDVEANKKTARRWSEELWSQGNLTIADEIVAADYERHDPGDPFPARGPEGVKRLVTMLRAML